MTAAVLAAHYFPAYTHYAPMEAAALEKYRFFTKLGFFGVTRHSFESQRKLVEIASQVLSENNSALWITPQGRFSDVRERPLAIGKGLPHLVRNSPDCVVLPVALEYCFWEESKPEVLVRFGSPLSGQDLQSSLRIPQFFELHLEETMDALSRSAIARESAAFRVILSGKSGVGGVYDLCRRVKARLRGSEFHPQHGEPRS
jgi:hypothetical protein